MATWPFCWGPTSLVSANRRVTLLGPPNRWCTNSKAPTVQIESLRIWSNVTGWYFPNRRRKALKCYLKCMVLNYQLDGRVVGMLPKKQVCTDLKIIKEKDRFMIHGKQNGKYHLSHASCCKPKKNAWELEVLFLLTPRIPLQKVFAVSLYCRSIFIDLSRADSAQIFGSIFKVLGEKQPPSHLEICWFFYTASVYYYYQRCQTVAGITQHFICCWLYILRITQFHTSPNISGT